MDIFNLILITVVILQSLIVLATLRHHPAEVKKEKSELQPVVPPISPEDIAKLQQATQVEFEKAVKESAKTFHGDLVDTSSRLNKLIVQLTTDVVEREMEAYRQSLTQARSEALEALKQMQTAVEQKQKDLESDVASELAKRQAYLAQRLDAHLGEAVASYIVESLGQGADLGAQRGFLLDSLEKHKAALKKEISGAAGSAK